MSHSERALILSEIWIYPVKSLGGISCSAAEVMQKGLRHDRRWMLVDDQGKFLTQRKNPTMALFKVSMENDQFVVQKDGDKISLPGRNPEGPGIRCQVWNDEVETVEASGDYHAWFSKHMGISCRLVFFPEENSRRVNPEYAVSEVSLADGYPILVIGQSSLDDLNDRLHEPVTMKRFRPNLVFTGGLPYEEDKWKTFRIGSRRFAGVKPCDRCVLTTVDPETGVMGREPLLTLSRYRRQNESINFGQNVVPIEFGKITVGDEISME